MGWGYLANGGGGKPWAKRSAEDRYQSKAERFAKLRQVQADKRAQALASADAEAKQISRELAAKSRSEAQAPKPVGSKRGPAPGSALNVSTGKGLLAKHGPSGRPAGSEIGPRFAGLAAVAPAPVGYAQMRAKQAAASAAARAGKSPAKPGRKGGK